MALHFSARHLLLGVVALFSVSVLVSAQSSSNNASGTSSPPDTTESSFSADATTVLNDDATLSLSAFITLTTSSVTTTSISRSGDRNIPITTVVPTVFNVTATATATVSASSTSASASSSASPSDDIPHLDTKIDPAFGVLGAILILTGLPSAFLGHKNRWTSIFLVGFYTLALVCFVLILNFGILPAVNPPNATLRGLFVLSSGVAGFAGGGIAIFFWKATRFFIGGWGGFALALWVQCFRNGGLIRPIGLRWIMYIAAGAVGFVLCTIPKIHYHILLISTAIVGATSVILGIDCFTRGNLKEFYIWNIGFDALFPKYTENNIQFPVTQLMQIELGLMGAVALIGMAIQFQVFKILHRKLMEIKEEQRRLDEAAISKAADRFAVVEQEKEEWERAHPSLAKHGRNDSAMTATTLKDPEAALDEKRTSTFTLIGSPRQRQQSGLSEFIASPPPPEELNRAVRQTAGALPLLDLGTDLESDVPPDFIADTATIQPSSTANTKKLTSAELEDLKKKEELLAEIQAARKSIERLRGDTPPSSSTDTSRRPSYASRPHTTYELATVAGPSHLRPPRQPDPRGRTQSMDLTRFEDIGSSIGRPSSTPLHDDNWDAYVRDRKLLQPPSGVTPPIPTTPVSPTPRLAVAPAVTEALLDRRRRESSLSFGGLNVPPAQPSPVLRSSSGTPMEVYQGGSTAPASAAALHAVSPPPLAGVSSMGATVSPTVKRHSQAPFLEDPTAYPPELQKQSHSQGTNPPVVILPPRKPLAPAPKRPEQVRMKTYEELAERHREKIRQLQAPVTQAEEEQLQVAEAKRRWERAKEMEKRALEKREAEKAKEAKEAKKKSKTSGTARGRSASPEEDEARPKGHNRSLSADVLAHVPNASTSSKRMSVLKVDDWQKHQLRDFEVGMKPPRHNEPTPSRRRSEVPFPADPHPQRRQSGLPRDPIT